MLRNVRAATRPGATVLLVELVIPEHNREFLGKWLDPEMLLCLPARERTAAEYRGLLEQAGFRMTRVVPTASPFSVVEATAV
ncbi:MAG: methyltransferase [Mycobacterium sp.]